MELKLLTVNAAAERLGIGAHLIYRAAQRGDLETLAVPGQQVIFTEEALVRWIARRADAGNAIDVPGDEIITAAELANATGRPLQTVTNWIRHGKATGQMVRGRWAFTWDEARRLAIEKGFLDKLEELERRRRAA